MLNDKAIHNLILNNDLITSYIDLPTQLQPAGFDITLRTLEEFTSHGAVDFSNRTRKIATTEVMLPTDEGWYHLSPGGYKVTFNEIVKLPLNLATMTRTRSSVLRNGAAIETGLGDPGYDGRYSSLFTVFNKYGIWLKQDARIGQLIFLTTVEEASIGYNGIYKGENI